MYYQSRLFIKVKDKSVWESFFDAIDEIPNVPEGFEKCLSTSPSEKITFVSNYLRPSRSMGAQWNANIEDADAFISALVDIAPEKFIALSDTHSSAGTFDMDGVNYYLGVGDCSYGGEPTIIDVEFDEEDFMGDCDEDYLDYDPDDFPSRVSPAACQISHMTEIDDPRGWIRFGIATGIIDLTDEEDSFLKEMGIDVH